MRHGVAHRKLGRVTEHRIALLRNQAQALLRHERIETTLPKAKELRPYVERIISIAKRSLVAQGTDEEKRVRRMTAERLVARDVADKKVVTKLFDTLAPRFVERPGGYTRLLKLGHRRGDAAHAPAPSSGQGASMALEDAVVLAKALRDSDSVEAGFAAYEAARRDRVERIVAQGARSSSTKTPGPIGRFVRDTFLRLAFRYFMTPQSMAWIYDHRIDWRRPFVVADARLTPSRTLG